MNQYELIIKRDGDCLLRHSFVTDPDAKGKMHVGFDCSKCGYIDFCENLRRHLQVWVNKQKEVKQCVRLATAPA